MRRRDAFSGAEKRREFGAEQTVGAGRVACGRREKQPAAYRSRLFSKARGAQKRLGNGYAVPQPSFVRRQAKSACFCRPPRRQSEGAVQSPPSAAGFRTGAREVGGAASFTYSMGCCAFALRGRRAEGQGCCPNFAAPVFFNGAPRRSRSVRVRRRASCGAFTPRRAAHSP